MSIAIIVHTNYRLARPEANGLKPYKQDSSGRPAHSQLVRIQPLLIYNGPQLIERTDLTNHQLGSNLHNQSCTGQSLT